MHIPYPAIVQTKKITACVVDIYASGSSFLDASRQVAPTLRSFDKPSDMRLISVKGESDVSRLQSLNSFLFVTLVPFFVSIMFVLRIDRGDMHGKMGDWHRSGGMRGRLWISVAIDGRLGR